MLKSIGTCYGNDPKMLKEIKSALEAQGYEVALSTETTGIIIKEVDNFYEDEPNNTES